MPRQNGKQRPHLVPKQYVADRSNFNEDRNSNPDMQEDEEAADNGKERRIKPEPTDRFKRTCTAAQNIMAGPSVETPLIIFDLLVQGCQAQPRAH